MNDTFPCGDQEALVAYLYDEGDPADRERVAAHVARCASCADDIESLGAARAQLAAWTPPAASLGFRITGAAEQPEPTALRPPAPGRRRAVRDGGWWREPLPAWAQAAAAALIFAAGMTVGASRDTRALDVAEAPPAAPAPVAIAAAPAEGPAAAPSVSPEDLARVEQDVARVEQRLRGEMAQLRSAASTPAAAAIDEEALVQRVQAVLGDRLAESEERQRRDILLIADVVRDLDAQQRGLEEELGYVQRVIVQEQQQQRNALSSLGSFVSMQQPAGGR